ncbi:hypothetical protein SDC9_178323 [bioreactor metagenome]|uniref:Uncharacterized protein n=1 Tax=bioreactor metagenome TaxID=1076179 RepID=A0A645GXS9_9ZZZZ
MINLVMREWMVLLDLVALEDSLVEDLKIYSDLSSVEDLVVLVDKAKREGMVHVKDKIVSCK